MKLKFNGGVSFGWKTQKSFVFSKTVEVVNRIEQWEDDIFAYEVKDDANT